MVGISKYQELEKKWAGICGSKYAVSCNSGTSALTLALAALKIGRGDEVIVPDFTMAATAFAVSYRGATPVFVDCGEDLNIDPKQVNKKITKKTKAIMVTHIYGRVAGTNFGLPVIEDACEAHGAVKRNGKRVGSENITCFSFFKNKIVSSEEGGMVNTNSKALFERMSDLKSMMFGKKHDYSHTEIGYNFRMPETIASKALASMAKMGGELKKREKIAEIYKQSLAKYSLGRPKGSVYWVYDLIFNSERQRNRILYSLKNNGIRARHFFKPMSTLPMYRGRVGRCALDYSERGLYVPVDVSEKEALKITRLILKQL